MSEPHGTPASVAPSVRRERHPTFEVLDRVLSPRCRLNSTERLVALALGARMNMGGECFPSVDYIAARIGRRERAVQYALKTLIEGDQERWIKPLFGRRWDPARLTPTYFLVRNPPAFVEARDKARSRNPVRKTERGPKRLEQKQADQEMHIRRLDLQRAMLKGDFNEEEYRQRLAELEVTNR